MMTPQSDHAPINDAAQKGLRKSSAGTSRPPEINKKAVAPAASSKPYLAQPVPPTSSRSRPTSANNVIPPLVNPPKTPVDATATGSRSRRGSDVPSLRPQPPSQQQGMIKSNSFDSRSLIPEGDQTSSVGSAMTSHAPNNNNSGSRINTPSMSRRGSNAKMMKNKSFDVVNENEHAPGVAVYSVAPRTILQKELETLSAVTKRLQDSGEAENGDAFAEHNSPGLSSRTLTPASQDHIGSHGTSRRGSGDLNPISRPKTSNRAHPKTPLKQEIPREPEPESQTATEGKPHGIMQFMDSIFTKKHTQKGKHSEDDSHEGKHDQEMSRVGKRSSNEIAKLAAGHHEPDLIRPRPKYSLKDFEIKAQIGRGAFARVHLVKFKTSRPPTTSSSRGNFQIHAMKSLRKPDIVLTKQDPRHLYLVMEYVPGGDMFTHLRKNRRFPEPIAKFYTVELVLAMEHIHSRGIIYRDLKPENVLMDREGHIKIADFGFARAIGPKERAMTFCGTPAYMAPEIILKVGYTKAVDWWSLGIVCYELQAGYSPFHAETPLQIYEKIMDGNMRWSSQIGGVSKDLLTKFLEMDPSNRLGSDGSKAIRHHPWFKDIDWRAHEARSVLVPYKPDLKGDEDISNFDVYDDQNSVVQMHQGKLEMGPDDLLYDEYFKDF
ncbi:hypothetical protein HDU97_006432 [Phlyctochytrium planicorne]|nr:hypothetical protein HDU97_006432 [Phlyctochytrium planicorne]